MKFNSQICTTREQSERLIALGLRKETADLSYNYQRTRGDYELSVNAYADILRLKDRMNNRKVLGMGWDELWGNDLPAWSLHRLIELIDEPEHIARWIGVQIANDYDYTVDCIEWLIKEGYFNKEYLVCDKKIG